MIWIFAVIYNTYPEALRFWESIKESQHSGLKLCFIDNSQIAIDKEFKQTIESHSDVIKYIKPSENLGYFGGAQFALETFLEKNPLPDWIIVSNVDIIVSDILFFQKLEKLNSKKNLAVVAPSIVSTRWKTDANPKYKKRLSYNRFVFYKYITKFWFIHNLYIALSYIKKYLKHYLINKSTLKSNCVENIYCAHGAFLIFHKPYFEHGGNFKHFSFLFGEEFFVSENVLKMGLDIEYHPELIISDFEHTSTGLFYSRKISGYMHQSTLDIIKKYLEPNE